MIDIDGSYEEGGGQIVRTAAALSAVTGKSVRIKLIRQARPRPGLAPQHARAITALASICHAHTSGIEPGSSEITFEPGEIRGGQYRVEIGTAGSVTLLMQCLLPAMLRADGPVSLQVHGGTDVRWAPTIDYFRHVFLPALSCFGARVSLELGRRGYYPQGQGSVLLKAEPADLRHARLSLLSATVHGISHCSNLPEHVAKRQADSAVQTLQQWGRDAQIDLEVRKLPSTGSGITIWSGYKGASALGERGLPAETIGENAAEEFLTELRSGAAVDAHLSDQLIPYLALAGGSYTTREISRHTRTNIWTARHFLDREISIIEDGLFRIEAAAD